MTDIKRKALELVNAVREEKPLATALAVQNKALCRAIEQHEAFKQEVSDAVEAYLGHQSPWPDTSLRRFIIPKPVDPLVGAWQMAFPGNHIEDARDECAKISAAIENCGGKIVWGEG